MRAERLSGKNYCNMANTFLIYGANGYTGELITRMAAERGLKPIVAGRNEAKIAELAEKYDFEHRTLPACQ